MKIIFSRKGFDAGSGGGPSPIVGGRTCSLPIPAMPLRSRPGARVMTRTTYASLGLGDLLAAARSRVPPHSLCHDDPMFAGDWCWFGQCGGAQTHLLNQKVGVGDLFLFFGLFVCPATRQRHHRIFGYLKVAGHASPAQVRSLPDWREAPREHPHFVEDFPANNCLWFGPGATGAPACEALRLTAPEGPTSNWIVPAWLSGAGLSHHGNPARWQAPQRLRTVGRGQEFVCDIGDNREAQSWADAALATIRSPL